MKNNMLNKLKSGYEQLEIKPSSDLWSRLDDKLDKKPEKPLYKPFQWWKYAAVVVLFISIGSILYFKSREDAFDDNETDYIVKKELEKTVNPINPEFQNQGNLKKLQTRTVKTTDVHIADQHQEKNTGSSSYTEKAEKVFSPGIRTVEVQQLAVTQPEKTDIVPVTIENRTPVLAQGKTAKPTYINSNELLLGREFDKARGTSDNSDIKFGIFNFEKPKPKVENVTVLGVTVYVDPK